MSEVDERDVRLKLVRAAGEPEPRAVYSNSVQVTTTPEDFTLHFGWYTTPVFLEPPEGAQIEVAIEPVVRITVPLNLMRNLIALLERQVSAYETNWGPIPDHPNKPAWMRAPTEDAQDVNG